MQLTLLIPGLPGAESATVERRFPALEMLLCRADQGEALSRSSLDASLELFDIPPVADLDIAAIAWQGEGNDPVDTRVVRADPVHLRADGDRLVLYDASMLELTMDEARSLAAAVQAEYTDENWRIEVPHPCRWYLHIPEPAEFQARPPNDLSGRDIDAWLPDGEHAMRWRRTLNEVQMILHSCDVNAAREQQGKPAVNSLWFWGAGGTVPQPGREWDAIWASEPEVSGLAAGAGIVTRPVPPDAKACIESASTADRQLIVLSEGLQFLILDDGDKWADWVAGLDTDWFQPLLVALRSRRLQRLTLAIPGWPRYDTTSRSLRRWWRRPRPLGTYALSDREREGEG